MEGNRPVLVTTEEVEKLPLLIIDKKGLVGSVLAGRLREQFLTVLISRDLVDVDELDAHQNMIHIPYRKKIPVIPDNIYSHIFVVYNGESEILDILPVLMRKAHESRGRILFITPLSQMNQKLYAHLANHVYHDMGVIVFGDVFDDKIRDGNQLNFFIHQARTYGRVEVPNAGLGVLYPMFFDDALSAIIGAAFAHEKKKRYLFVFPHYPITEISLARMLQKIDPLIKIDFKKQRGKRADFYVPPDGEYVYHNYDLEERLKTIGLSRRGSTELVPQKKIKLDIPRQRSTHGMRKMLLWAIVLFLSLPPVLAFVFAVAGAAALGVSVQRIEKAEFVSAKQYASFAHIAFVSANTLTKGVFVLDVVAPQQKRELVAKTQLGKDVVEMELDVLQAVISLQGVFDGKSLDPKHDFLRGTAAIKNALLTVQKMKAENKLPKSTAQKIDELQYEIRLFENSIDVLPSLLGFEGKKSYLVLFQNNTELRPGGGFIGSYGVLGVENGKMDTFKIYDVYDADGKLTSHVEPPYGLRRHLGSAHWFLRDSNFDVDFTRNAANAARFLKMEMGQGVDGVIAIDTEFLKNILSALGTVSVIDYNETVTADTFYLQTQTHAEKDFFPGSTQKKDFLRSLSNSILGRLAEKKDLPYLALVKKVGQSVREKHVLFANSDAAIQDLFTVNNISASLWDGRGKDADVFLDTFGVVDANVGANKTNQYLKRSLDQQVVLEEGGKILTTATITYENTSTKDSPFGGHYKNYVRFLLPPKAALESVTIDNREIATVPAVTDPAIFTKTNFIPPKELEIEKAVELGKTSIGFLVIVPTETTKTVAITYSVTGVVSTQSPAFTYDMLLLKQPGTLSDAYSLTVKYPDAFRLVGGDVTARDIGGKVVYETKLSEDKNVVLEFSKK